MSLTSIMFDKYMESINYNIRLEIENDMLKNILKERLKPEVKE